MGKEQPDNVPALPQSHQVSHFTLCSASLEVPLCQGDVLTPFAPLGFALLYHPRRAEPQR